MKAYADAIVNEACIDCWAQHNIVDNDAGDDTDFVDPFPFPLIVQKQVMNPAPSVNSHMDLPVTKQQQRKRPGPQDGTGVNLRQPFRELGCNIRSGLKRLREAGEEEDELERRWRDRARNRETVKSGAKIAESVRKHQWGENKESELVVID